MTPSHETGPNLRQREGTSPEQEPASSQPRLVELVAQTESAMHTLNHYLASTGSDGHMPSIRTLFIQIRQEMLAALSDGQYGALYTTEDVEGDMVLGGVMGRWEYIDEYSRAAADQRLPAATAAGHYNSIVQLTIDRLSQLSTIDSFNLWLRDTTLLETVAKKIEAVFLLLERDEYDTASIEYGDLCDFVREESGHFQAKNAYFQVVGDIYYQANQLLEAELAKQRARPTNTQV